MKKYKLTHYYGGKKFTFESDTLSRIQDKMFQLDCKAYEYQLSPPTQQALDEIFRH